MRWAVIAGVVALAEPAHAGRNCGGGGGGTSDGGGVSSSSSSSSEISYDSSPSYSSFDTSSDSTDSEPRSVGGCIDNTDVVGYRQCTKFGAWANNTKMPRMFFELGSNVRQYTTGLGAQSGNVEHGAESFSYRVMMPTESERARDVAVTTALRFGVGLPHHLYTGVEVELGGLVAPAAATAEMTSTGSFGAPSMSQSGGMVFGALGLAGLRGTTSRGSFAIEAAGGVRNTSYNFHSSYHLCEETTSVNDTRGVVEARARAELWLGPWFTAGATLGANVLSIGSGGDWLAGIYLGLHTRAFGGSR